MLLGMWDNCDLLLYGKSGGGSTSYNTGVMVTDSGALTLQNRNSQVTGLGGGGGAGSHNHGVYVAGAGTISFTNANGGAGTPVLTGLGGASRRRFRLIFLCPVSQP